MKTKSANIMVIIGILVILLGAGNAWYQYQLNHSPLDTVDTSLQSLDQSNAYIPMVQPQDGSAAPTLALRPDSLYQDPRDTPEYSSDPGLSPGQTATAVTPEVPVGMVPDRLVIPAIYLDAPVVPIHFKTIVYLDKTFQQWIAPNEYAAGWQDTSALIGLPGNTVFNGHHNAYGKVFQDLLKLQIDDFIMVYSGEHVFTYQVKARMLLPERYQPIEVREDNARWIMPSNDERITLVTCWPADSNNGRVIIVAYPVHN